MAIFGGALLPVAVGTIADRFGLTSSFIIPLVAYAFIAFFAVAARAWGNGSDNKSAVEPPASASPIP